MFVFAASSPIPVSDTASWGQTGAIIAAIAGIVGGAVKYTINVASKVRDEDRAETNKRELVAAAREKEMQATYKELFNLHTAVGDRTAKLAETNAVALVRINESLNDLVGAIRHQLRQGMYREEMANVRLTAALERRKITDEELEAVQTKVAEQSATLNKRFNLTSPIDHDI